MWRLCLIIFVFSSLSPSLGVRIQAAVFQLHEGNAPRNRNGKFADDSRRRSDSPVHVHSSSISRSKRRSSSHHGRRRKRSHQVDTKAVDQLRSSKNRQRSANIIGGHVDSDGTIIQSPPKSLRRTRFAHVNNNVDDGNSDYEDASSDYHLENASTLEFDADGDSSEEMHGPKLQPDALADGESDNDYDASRDGDTDDVPTGEVDSTEYLLAKILSGEIAASEESENHMNAEIGRKMVKVKDLEVQATAEKYNVTPAEVMSRGLPLVNLADSDAHENIKKRRARVRSTRNGGMGFTPWPNTVISYKFHSSLPSEGRKAVESALQEIKRATCLSFKEEASFSTGPVIDVRGYNEGCYAELGYQGREQSLNLSTGCQHHGIAVHEFSHALGKHHEQTRQDRDNYVQIAWQNIDHKYKHNFNKETKTWTKLGYDFKSIMHYGETDFSINGQATIVSRDGLTRKEMGQRKSLSISDCYELNAMYCGSYYITLSWWLQSHYDKEVPMQLTAEAHSSAGTFAVAYAKPGRQTHWCSLIDSFGDWYKKMYSRGYRLTAFKYSEQGHKYCGTMSTDAGIRVGKYWRTPTSALWNIVRTVLNRGGTILDVDYGRGHWMLASGQTPEFLHQSLKYCEWTCARAWILKMYRSGYQITAIAKDDVRPKSRFLVVMSQTMSLRHQMFAWKSDRDISVYLQAIHNRGYVVTSIVDRYPLGGGAHRFLVVSSSVLQSNFYPSSNYRDGLDPWAASWGLKV